MEFIEISPFLFVLSEEKCSKKYSELSLEDYKQGLETSISTNLFSKVSMILKEFPHRNYVPLSYFTKHSMLKDEDPCKIIHILLEFPELQATFHKSKLCFAFSSKQKVAKLSEIIEENPFSMLNEVIKTAANVKKGKIGEDLLVSLTNGTEKMYRNNSENYLKTICERSKENRRFKKKSDQNFSEICKRALRDISNSGN